MKKRNNRNWLLVGLILLVALAAAGWWLAPDKIKQQLGFKTQVNPAYSEHQQKVVANFGEPDAFKLVMNLDDPRRETWFYYQLGEAFVFEDGQFLARTHQDFDIKNRSDLVTVKFKPADFYQIETMGQLTNLTGVEPNFSGEINPEVLEDAQFYSFADALDVGLIDDQVVFIKTNAFRTDKTKTEHKQQKDLNPSSQPTQATQKDSSKSNQIMTSPDKVFQINAGVLATNMTVAVEEPDFAQKLYTFCVRVDDPNLADFFCEGQARPVFNIAAYSFSQFEEQTNSPLYSQETEPTLGTYDDTIYTFSHINGDVPDEIQGQADQYFKAVRDSFQYLR